MQALVRRLWLQKVGTKAPRRLGDCQGARDDAAGLLAVVEAFHRNVTPDSLNLIQEVVSRASSASASASVPVRGADPSVQSLEQDILRLFTFHEQEHLLRGSRLASILKQRGAAFDFGPSASAHAWSVVVERIDCFISHNWSVPRLQKFVCLALHFNSTLLVLSVLTVPTIMLMLPALPGIHGLATLLCLLALSLFYDLTSWLRCCRGPQVFLDKTCINQTDPELQRQAIERIGAFIARSSTMVVILTDEYLQKLWTVYEVACFLVLRSTEGLTMLSVEFPAMFLACMIVVVIGHALRVSLFVSGVREELLQFFLLLLLAIAFRWHARLTARICDQLARFDVCECRCSSEADRPILYANIGVLMRAMQLVPEGTTDEHTLVAFSKLVRDELAGMLAQSSGFMALPYVSALTLSLLWSPLNLSRTFQKGNVFGALGWCGNVAVLAPLTLRLQAICASLLMDLRGWREVLYLLCGNAGILLVIEGLRSVWAQAIDTEDWLVISLTCIALSALAFGPDLRLRFASRSGRRALRTGFVQVLLGGIGSPAATRSAEALAAQ